jgi:acetyl esterase/lipase
MTMGSVDMSVPDLRQTVAQTGVPIFSVGYTLAPTGQAPMQVIERYAAFEYLIGEGNFRVDKDRIGVMGNRRGEGWRLV